MKGDKNQSVLQSKHNQDPANGYWKRDHLWEIYEHKQDPDTANNLTEGILQVAVIGVTGNGKTTLINALVREELLPTSIEVNTGAIVKIVPRQNTDAATLVEQGVPRTVTRKEFRDFIQIPPELMGPIHEGEAFPLPDRLNRLDYAELPHNNHLTRHNIILVDTLGFNAGPKAAAVTERFLTEADAYIVVLQTSPPITESDVILILEQVGGAIPPKRWKICSLSSTISGI